MKLQNVIRSYLRNNEDGATIAELSQECNALKNSIYVALKSMPDAYIDRWTEAEQQRPYEAIWCVVNPPEDCPYPERK